jgi:hypothetical protein
MIRDGMDCRREDGSWLCSLAEPAGRFETRWLAAEKNLSALFHLSGQWIVRVHDRRPPRGVVLDMDWSVSDPRRTGAECLERPLRMTFYHPLFVFNQFGVLEHRALRPGNVHSADGWESVLKPVVVRYRGKVSRINFPRRRGFRQSRGLRVPQS